MVSYGQKKLNRDEVRKATMRFVLSFIALSALSFAVVYLFFKSSQVQANNIRSELDEYHSMLGRNELLKVKMDSINYKMSLLSNDKVENDIFLRNSVIEDMNLCRQLIGKDSADNLRHYHTLLKQMQPMLTFKNELIKQKSEEKAAARNLQECIGQVGRISTSMAPRPQRRGNLFR